MAGQPTIVLVHGAFVDASSWAPVTRLLLDRGHTVLAPAVPNRGLVADALCIRVFVEQIDDPVILVGHSYGGAVIGVAGMAENVVGLVYVAGYALDEGESLGQLQGRFEESDLPGDLVYTPFPNGQSEPGTDASVRIDAFSRVFAAGVDSRTAEVLAVSQRPLSASAFGEPAPVAAWKTKPSWGLISAADRTINPAVQQFGYSRAGMKKIVEVASAPHLVMHQNAQAVVDLITDAVDTLST